MEDLESEKKLNCYMNKRKKLVVILFVQSTSFIFLYNYDTTLLLNFTSSAYFSLTKDMKYFQPMLYWSMMINFVNVFTDDNTLQDKYSPQCESFIWRILYKIIFVTTIKILKLNNKSLT